MESRRQQLEQLDKATLIEQYLLLEKRVETLEWQLSEFKRALGINPSKTPDNSSVPPSQGHKANVEAKQKAKRGPKRGHAGKSRQRQSPDEIVECRLRVCGACGTDVSNLPQHEVGRHQVIDIPPIRPTVREVVRYGRYCPTCDSYQRAEAPAGYERGRVVGPHLEGLVLYLHYAHPLSYQRVQHMLGEMCGLSLGVGTLVNIVKRGQTVLEQGAEAIRKRIQQATVIGSDETGARVNGQNHCQWVFQTPQWVYFVIRRSKRAQELQDVIGQGQPQVWVSDAGSSQMKHPAKRYQLCLAHLIRKLQYVIDSDRCLWANQMQDLLLRAIRLAKNQCHLTEDHYALQIQAVHYRLDQLLKQEPPIHRESYTLWLHFHKHRQALLVFLERDDVPPTNNASEQALRNSVIYRKVTGGFRSQWGADVYANLISILETARRQGLALFDILISIFTPTPAFSWIGE